MNTYDKKQYLLIFLFSLCIFLPYILWTVFGRYLELETNEKRDLAGLPRINVETITSFPGELEVYINDHLPFRNQLIQMNSLIDYYIFGDSVSEKVILGEDNWLFYSATNDGNPMNSYRGQDLFTEEQLEQIAYNLELTQENLENEGCEFILFIVPNKERVYYEKLPDYYGTPEEEYAALQLINYLKKNTDIKVVYPYDELREAAEKYDVYRKTDTHWNSLGAYIGTCSLLEELAIDLPHYESSQVVIEEKPDEAGDLANMLSLNKYVESGKAYNISGFATNEMENSKWDFDTEFIYSSQCSDDRKIFIRRDSFCSEMSDIIGSQFKESYMPHRLYYDNAQVREQKPDIFVYETIERYLPKVIDFCYDIEKE